MTPMQCMPSHLALVAAQGSLEIIETRQDRELRPYALHIHYSRS